MEKSGGGKVVTWIILAEVLAPVIPTQPERVFKGILASEPLDSKRLWSSFNNISSNNTDKTNFSKN